MYVHDLVPIAAINSFHTNIVRKYIQQRFAIMVSRFFANTGAFSRRLSDCHDGVSGSAGTRQEPGEPTGTVGVTRTLTRDIPIPVPTIYLYLHNRYRFQRGY